MGKQINYYMEYDSFVHVAEKALELGCEIIQESHANGMEEIQRGFSSDLVIPDCKWYYFHVLEAGEVAFIPDKYGKFFVDHGYSASGNTLIEAGYSYISAKEEKVKRIGRARLFTISGYYDENENFIKSSEKVTKIYNALARYVKKIAPYTEITDPIINTQKETYLQQSKYIRKEYITDYCLRLRNEGFTLG